MGFILGAHQNLETQAAGRCGYGDVVLRNEAALLVKLRKDICIVLRYQGGERLYSRDFADRFEASQTLRGSLRRIRQPHPG